MIGRLWPRGERSLQRRLTVLTALVVGLAVFATSLAGYVVARVSVYQQLDEELLETAQGATAPLAQDLSTMGGLRADTVRSVNSLFMVLRADGVSYPVPGTPVTLPAGPEELSIARLQRGSSVRTVVLDGTRYRVVAVPIPDLGGPYALVVARPLSPYDGILGALLVTFITTGVIGVVAAGLIGSGIARSGLRSLHEVSRAVRRVSETDQLDPIPVQGTAELAALTQSFNTMLRSLRTSRERQSRLIADAGHELRTPLTSMRTNIELLVADEKAGMLPEGARAETLKDVAAQLAEFSALVGDLVQLTREDGTYTHPEPLDLAEVVGNAVDRARRRGPGLTFDVHLSPHRVMGEADTLERAVTNLLDNAVKFSPEGGTVRVVLSDGVLTVSDDGPGVTPGDRERVFDRFFRAETARNTPGTGLGLSIVEQTVTRHGGSIEVGEAPSGGAEFRMSIPEG